MPGLRILVANWYEKGQNCSRVTGSKYRAWTDVESNNSSLAGDAQIYEVFSLGDRFRLSRSSTRAYTHMDTPTYFVKYTHINADGGIPRRMCSKNAKDQK